LGLSSIVASSWAATAKCCPQGTHLDRFLPHFTAWKRKKDLWVTAFPCSNMRFQPDPLSRTGRG
jgi:hypothetical protein